VYELKYSRFYVDQALAIHPPARTLADVACSLH